MIIFDSSFLVVLLHPNPPPAKDRDDKPVSQFRERVAYLAATMDVSNDPIGVPAPAMAEVLVGAGNGRAQYVSVLSNTWRFQILPFDSRAAIEASELIAKVKSNKESWGTWAKVKFDIQIVSIAKAEAATLIYADDRHIENLAKRLKIPVMRICDLPLPPLPVETETLGESGMTGSQQTLPLRPAINTTPPPQPIENKSNEQTIRTAQEGDKLQADPAHPAPVQGSDSGRAQSEAARESQDNKSEAEKERK